MQSVYVIICYNKGSGACTSSHLTSLSLSVSHLGQAGLCRQVLVVDLPQQTSLILLVHLCRADEQQGPSAALPAPFKPPLPPGEEIHTGLPSLCKIKEVIAEFRAETRVFWDIVASLAQITQWPDEPGLLMSARFCLCPVIVTWFLNTDTAFVVHRSQKKQTHSEL